MNRKINKLQIIITAPRKSKESWQISFNKNGKGGRAKLRKSAKSVYGLSERYLTRISKRKSKPQVALKVKDDREIINETEDSKDVNYLLYVMACFLEDFLPTEYVIRKYKKYNQWSYKHD